MKDPLTGKRKKKLRAKEDWIIKELEEMRIISDRAWDDAQKRWKEIEKIFPNGKGKKGFAIKKGHHIKSHPEHLFSGSLRCSECGGAICLVSGKGKGYYGCLNYRRKSCTNKVLISRNKLEKRFLELLYEEVLKPETIQIVYEKVAKEVKKQFAHVPEEIKQKRLELNAAEIKVKNFIDFIAQGRAPKSLAEALEQEEIKVAELREDLSALENSHCKNFKMPSKDWLIKRILDVKGVLNKKTGKSALLLRKLLGEVVLTPEIKDGRKYYLATTKLKTLELLNDSEKGSNVLRWWTS